MRKYIGKNNFKIITQREIKNTIWPDLLVKIKKIKKVTTVFFVFQIVLLKSIPRPPTGYCSNEGLNLHCVLDPDN